MLKDRGKLHFSLNCSCPESLTRPQSRNRFDWKGLEKQQFSLFFPIRSYGIWGEPRLGVYAHVGNQMGQKYKSLVCTSFSLMNINWLLRRSFIWLRLFLRNQRSHCKHFFKAQCLYTVLSQEFASPIEGCLKSSCSDHVWNQLPKAHVVMCWGNSLEAYWLAAWTYLNWASAQRGIQALITFYDFPQPSPALPSMSIGAFLFFLF